MDGNSPTAAVLTDLFKELDLSRLSSTTADGVVKLELFDICTDEVLIFFQLDTFFTSLPRTCSLSSVLWK